MTLSRQTAGSESGFTMLEILIAIFIIAIIAVSLLYVQQTSWFATVFANKTVRAGHMIEKRVEKIRMDISRDTSTAHWTDSIPENTLQGDSTSEKGITVRWTCNCAHKDNLSVVACSDANAIVDVRRIEFHALWRTNRLDSFVVVTYVSKLF